MEPELRTCTEEEIGPFLTACEAAFGSGIRDESLTRLRKIIEADRSLAAWENGTMVGTAGAYSLTMPVPGGEIPVAGVTMVGVLPTHRRRGLLTRMMTTQLADVRERGESVAVLWASEASIYQRFGYGPASMSLKMELQRDRVRWLKEPASPLIARLLSVDEAVKALPSIYDEARREIPGMVSRTEAWWINHRLPDPEEDRDGGGPMFRVLIEHDGEPAAYALYRVTHRWEQPVPSGILDVIEAVATSPGSHRDLWRFLLGVDLVTKVRSWFEPVDSPLILSLQEVNRLFASAHDGLWLRIVDVEAALSQRGYDSDGTLVLSVTDRLLTDNEGTWTVQATGGRAKVSRSSDAPMLRLAIEDLASVYLGAFTFNELFRAGRVEELSPGALEAADRLFRTPRKPWCPEVF
jgi:predicted acetyltransferase